VIDAARPSRHAHGDPWFVDETYVKVIGKGARSFPAEVFAPAKGTVGLPIAMSVY
jgi:transposase-like protein